jgi:hypothetical protein
VAAVPSGTNWTSPLTIPIKLKNATSREDEMGRACSTNMEKRNVYRILVESQKERDH